MPVRGALLSPPLGIMRTLLAPTPQENQGMGPDGCCMNVFKLLQPEGLEGHRKWAKWDWKGWERFVPKCNFTNRLGGHQVYMGVVMTASPERGWHLKNHLGNVLRAKGCVRGGGGIRECCIPVGHAVWRDLAGKGDLGMGSRWSAKQEAPFQFCRESNQG